MGRTTTVKTQMEASETSQLLKGVIQGKLGTLPQFDPLNPSRTIVFGTEKEVDEIFTFSRSKAEGRVDFSTWQQSQVPVEGEFDAIYCVEVPLTLALRSKQVWIFLPGKGFRKAFLD